jgi:hypothetical protein
MPASSGIGCPIAASEAGSVSAGSGLPLTAVATRAGSLKPPVPVVPLRAMATIAVTAMNATTAMPMKSGVRDLGAEIGSERRGIPRERAALLVMN